MPSAFPRNTGDNKMSFLEELKENFSKRPIITRILFFLLLISFIYDIYTGKAFSIFFSAFLLLYVASELIYWFKNREKE